MTFGRLLQASIIPCPDEHPVTIKSVEPLANRRLTATAISIYENQNLPVNFIPLAKKFADFSNFTLRKHLANWQMNMLWSLICHWLYYMALTY